MNAVDRNFSRMSGRLRALEQLVTVLLIELANRADGDPVAMIEAARKYSMLTVQTQDRPVDPATDFEAGVMIDALDEIFASVRANLQ